MCNVTNNRGEEMLPVGVSKAGITTQQMCKRKGKASQIVANGVYRYTNMGYTQKCATEYKKAQREE